MLMCLGYDTGKKMTEAQLWIEQEAYNCRELILTTDFNKG